MKVLLIVLSVFAFTGCAQKKKKAEVKHSDLLTENIKGNVSQMTITPYHCDSTGKIGEMQDCCKTVFEYNEDGNLLKQVSTNKEGKITEEETTTIHETGFRTSVTTMQDGKRSRYIVFEMNDSGRYVSGKVLDSANQVSMYYEDLVMNEWGQPVSFTLYGKDSTIIMKEEAKYDGNKLLSYFQTDKNGKETGRYSFRYNDKNEMIEETRIENTEQGMKKTVYPQTYTEHDAKGNWTIMTRWDENGKALSILKREFVYRD